MSVSVLALSDNIDITDYQTSPTFACCLSTCHNKQEYLTFFLCVSTLPNHELCQILKSQVKVQLNIGAHQSQMTQSTLTF